MMRTMSALRERVWSRARFAAQQAGQGDFPICWHCGKPVTEPIGGDWHEAHVLARAFGGKRTVSNLRVAHPRCNIEDGHAVRSAQAKSDRVRSRHAGKRRRPRHPIPGQRCTRFIKSPGKNARLRTDVNTERASWRERMALKDADGNPIGVWATP